MKKKGKIALLVISLFFVLVFGALVIGHFCGIKLGDHLLNYIPLVKDYKWIAYIVSVSLLIIFAILAGTAAGLLKQTKRTVIIKKKVVAPKKTKNTKKGAAPAAAPIKTKVNF